MDGIVREVFGDEEAIKVKLQNLGSTVTPNHVVDKGHDILESDISGTEKIVIDPKRRLVETEIGAKDNGLNTMHTDGPNLKTGEVQR